VNTVHDEIVLEVASEQSNKAAIALEAAMVEGMLLTRQIIVVIFVQLCYSPQHGKS
jgi:hypothetical protein